jgi:hypothetical protein
MSTLWLAADPRAAGRENLARLQCHRRSPSLLYVELDDADAGGEFFGGPREFQGGPRSR